MKENMTLKEFMEEIFKQNMFQAMNTARDLIELEAIEKRINILWGIELEIKVKPVKKKEGRFYGKSVLDAIDRDFTKK